MGQFVPYPLGKLSVGSPRIIVDFMDFELIIIQNFYQHRLQYIFRIESRSITAWDKIKIAPNIQNLSTTQKIVAVILKFYHMVI